MKSLILAFELGCRYVLRRILRRSVRYATEKLNAPPGLVASLVSVAVDTLVGSSNCPTICHILTVLVSCKEHENHCSCKVEKRVNSNHVIFGTI